MRRLILLHHQSQLVRLDSLRDWGELTTERKRVTTAADFGATLTTLLSESARPPKKTKGKEREEKKDGKKSTAAPILSLSAKPLPPTRAAETLERRAARAIKAEKAERLDRARVKDVVEGWTPAEGAQVGSQEFERGLRKTAQRGGEFLIVGRIDEPSHQAVQCYSCRFEERRGCCNYSCTAGWYQA